MWAPPTCAISTCWGHHISIMGPILWTAGVGSTHGLVLFKCLIERLSASHYTSPRPSPRIPNQSRFPSTIRPAASTLSFYYGISPRLLAGGRSAAHGHMRTRTDTKSQRRISAACVCVCVRIYEYLCASYLSTAGPHPTTQSSRYGRRDAHSCVAYHGHYWSDDGLYCFYSDGD